jgi:hypothetical protein
METTVTSGTVGYLVAPLAIGLDPLDFRFDFEGAAAKAGGTLVGEPERVSVKDMNWSPGYESLADSTDLDFYRWKMVKL